MSDSYEKIVKSIHKRNDNLIYNFEGWLKRSGLGEKTVKNHVDNISFFLNDFVTYQDISEDENYTTLCHAEDGIKLVGEFLGYWFIRKAMWASESSIKSNITTIKKFYTFMQSLGLISAEELKDLNDEIKEYKQEWIDTVKRYDDPDVDFEDVWGF